MRESVIVSAVRTPTGKFLGALKSFTATQLGAQGLASPVEAAAAAQLLVTGNIGETAQHLPTAGAALLVHAYETAFERLLVVLATITVLTAIIVFLGLRRGSAAEQDVAAVPTCQQG